MSAFQAEHASSSLAYGPFLLVMSQVYAGVVEWYTRSPQK